MRISNSLLLGLVVVLAACGGDDDAATPDGPPGPVDAASDGPPAPIDAAPDAPPSDAVCGDGVTEAPEECDDGNTADDDGCSAICRRDPPGSLTFYIAGRLTAVDDPGNVLGGDLGIDTPFTGRYTYNPSAPDSNAATDVGDYNHTTVGYGMTLHIGSWTFHTDQNSVNYLYEVVNRATGGGMVMHSYTNVSTPGTSGVQIISWQLDAPAGTEPFASDAILTQCPDLTAFTQPFGLTLMGGVGDSTWFVRGTVESCTP